MAIAFDAATDLGSTLSGDTLTTAHTCTGTDRILFVGTVGKAGTDTISGVTYNGVAMTKIATAQVATRRYSTLWYLINPASGSNNVVISSSETNVIEGLAASYTGAKQSGQPDAQNTNTAVSSSSIAVSVTSVADNCWHMMFVGNTSGGSTSSAGSGTTQRVTGSTFFVGNAMLDSNGPKTPAGSYTLNNNQTDGTSELAAVAVSFAPAGGAPASSVSNLALLGVG